MYKSLWWFVSNPLYKLNIAEDYKDLSLLPKKGVYIMQAFDDNSFKGAGLKALNFAHKFIQAGSLAKVSTVGSNHISQQIFEAIVSNGLHGDLRWPKVPDVLANAFITL